ncbi:unnamed protein product [Psylliodes chrysocephalus]|uniref:Uncharacterized protein n=1 Tax=Psylliodes chrysocephalus TaxID=3402493 RepID=A0A9P0GIZ4_9CUCU|nr:unnamed protein product [Psylliodes chrysocephala]
MVESFTNCIKNAQNASLEVHAGTPRMQPYWWNEIINRIRKECNAARRKLSRSRTRKNNVVTTRLEDEYTKSRKDLKEEIKKRKEKVGRTFVLNLNKTSGDKATN